MAQNSDDILYDFTPRLKHYKDGRIQRLRGEETVPPSLDPTTGVHSKDVDISPATPLSARLYLPRTAAASLKKLPLLIYFHGGAFVTYSAFSPMYQNHLNLLVAESNVVAVSVNYRRPPETPLPGAFEDAWEALRWAASESADEWIKNHADMDNVFLGGDSAGGNIAHNTAVRLGADGGIKIKLAGMFLNCPFFWGKDPIGSELAEEFAVAKRDVDRLPFYIWPGLRGMDEAWLNPAMDAKVAGMAGGRVVVHVAEKDLLRDRGWNYKEVLEKSGWKGGVEVVEAKGEDHVYSVVRPAGENGLKMIQQVAAFINKEMSA